MLNEKAIWAICKGIQPRFLEMMGHRYLTNGYAAWRDIEFPDVEMSERPVEDSGPKRLIGELSNSSEVYPGQLFDVHGNAIRQFGSQYFMEALVLTVNPLTWRLGPCNEHLFAMDGKEAPLAVMMHHRADPIVPCEGRSESEIYAPFACAENGWYLQSAGMVREKLAERIKVVEREIRSAEDRRDDIEAEIEEMEEELTELRKQIREIGPC